MKEVPFSIVMVADDAEDREIIDEAFCRLERHAR
jgi:hypothetical protein